LLTEAIYDSELIAHLGLSEEQQTAFAALNASMREERFTAMRSAAPRSSRQRSSARARFAADALALLSPEQVEKLDALKADPENTPKVPEDGTGDVAAQLRELRQELKALREEVNSLRLKVEAE
jgi:hypothetical protein